MGNKHARQKPHASCLRVRRRPHELELQRRLHLHNLIEHDHGSTLAVCLTLKVVIRPHSPSTYLYCAPMLAHRMFSPRGGAASEVAHFRKSDFSSLTRTATGWKHRLALALDGRVTKTSPGAEERKHKPNIDRQLLPHSLPCSPHRMGRYESTNGWKLLYLSQGNNQMSNFSSIL